jgi:hypothetical protein
MIARCLTLDVQLHDHLGLSHRTRTHGVAVLRTAGCVERGRDGVHFDVPRQVQLDVPG